VAKSVNNKNGKSDKGKPTGKKGPGGNVPAKRAAAKPARGKAQQKPREGFVVGVQRLCGVSDFGGRCCGSGSGWRVERELAVRKKCRHEGADPPSVPDDLNFRPSRFHRLSLNKLPITVYR